MATNERGTNDARPALRRRGLIAGAAALVAGLATKQTAQPVAAVTNVVLQGMNTETGPTTITNTATDSLFSTALSLQSNGGTAGVGLAAIASNVGVSASGKSFGVAATAQSNIGVGVQGSSFPGDSAGAGIGVRGTSNDGTGVRGDIPTPSSAANTIAVFGSNQSTGSNGIAVFGSCANGTGVFGQTAASNQYGVLGTTFAPNSTAIAGTCTANGSSAFSGGTTNPNAFAGFFQGTVAVQGNFAVTGSKSAVIQHPRTGDHRLVYCVESPEAWFEDFGEGALTNGKASVTLDADFTALIHSDIYHVFLTPGADSKGLYVTNKTAGGFDVHEQQGGTSNLTFSWRVVARRADTKSDRLGKFTMPNLPLPDAAKFKVPPTPPAAPLKQS